MSAKENIKRAKSGADQFPRAVKTRMGSPGARRSWYQGKRPIFQFVLLFGLFMGLYYLLCATSFMRETVFPGYLRFNAVLSGAVLGWFEPSVTVSGQTIQGRFGMTIERGCDAIEPSALFLSGVLAFPSGLLKKVPGMLLGTLVLMVLNIVRIVSLYYVGVYFSRETFEIAHVNVWQALFIFLAILFWVLWALWAVPAVKESTRAPVAAT